MLDIGCFAGRRIAVLGDVMLDRQVSGSVTRISPEAPIPILKAEAQTASLGGAGNVATNIVRMGGEAILLGVVGNDDAARDIHNAAVGESKLKTVLIEDASRPTTVKARFLANGQHLLRVDHEMPGPISVSMADALLQSLRAGISGCCTLVLSDYAKGVLSPQVIAAAIATAHASGADVIVDPKGQDFTRYAGADLITPNALEASLATGMPCGSDDEVTAAARAIQVQARCAAVLVTRGSAGMTLVAEGGEVLHIRARAREVADVSGAGDTVVAALALAGAFGWAKAAELANQAAGIAVTKAGTQPVTADELLRAMAASEYLSGRGKLVTQREAAARAEIWRARGETVVFTNGCFDLLHPGHIHLLERARAAGDRLVVGLNSDASVRRLKGPQRPIQYEAARAAMLAVLDFVDLVTIFEADTPIDVIAALKPDVLVKGADYNADDIAGADIVRAAGGRVVQVPLLGNHSTTLAVEHMRGQ